LRVQSASTLKMRLNTFYSSVSLQTLALLALFVAPNLGAQDCNVGEQLQVAVGYRPEPARLSGTLSLQAMNALYTTAAPEQSRPVAGEPHSQSPRPTEAPEVNNTTPVSGTPALKKEPPVYGLISLGSPCGSCTCLGFCPFGKCVGVCLWYNVHRQLSDWSVVNNCVEDSERIIFVSYMAYTVRKLLN